MRFIAGWDEVLVSMTSGGGGELMGVSVSVWSAWLGGAMVAVCISIVGGCGGLHAKKREERERPVAGVEMAGMYHDRAT